MSKSAKQAPKQATVSLTIAGVLYVGTGKTRDEALGNMRPVEK